MSQKYYACRLKTFKRWNLTMDILTALAASSAFAGLAVWKTTEGSAVFSLLLAASALISVLRPILKLADGIDRFSKLHYGYAQLSFELESLTVQAQQAGHMTEQHRSAMADVEDKYRNLGLADEVGPKKRLLNRCQAEVNQAYPAERLWLPAA